MTCISGKHFLLFIVITTLIGITYSHENDTSTQGRRHSRVNGRIVKLYSGPKPDPILCHSEGFLADAVDCSVFYRCLKASNGKYTVYRFQCGPGTVYDPDTEICNHPRSTKRSVCGGINSDTHFSSTQRYIENEIEGLQKEIEELPSPIKTKPAKVNNSILNTKATSKPEKLESSYTTNIYPWVTTSKYESNIALAALPWNKPASLSSVTPWDYVPTQATTYVTPKPIRQNGVQCISDGFMGDNEDCRKFYRCVNNQRGGYLKYEFSCSESTIWDDDTKGCNHPWAVQRRRCGKGNSYIENTINYIDQNEVASNHVVQQQTQISYGSKVTQIQTQISKGPAIQNQPQIHFGDRINQEKLNGVQNQVQTNYGTEVNQNQSQINYGNEILQTPQTQVDYLSNSSQTQSHISDTTLSSTIIPTSTVYNKHSSTNKCTRAGFMSDSNDCKKFYRCITNEKGGFTMHEFSCSQGTLWDEDLEACNHAWAVKCGEKKTNHNKSSPATTITENTTVKDYITTVSPLYSNEITDIGYVTQNGQQEIIRPESSTKIIYLTTMTTKSPKVYEGDCNSSGFFGYAYDCSKFYRCVEDGSGRFKKYEYKCGDGTVWDPRIESCNHAWSVKSCNTNNNSGDKKENLVVPSSTDNTIITTVSLIQTTTQKNIQNNDFDSGYGNISREPPPQSTTVTHHITNQENECKNSGFMGDNKDCKLFYRCVENGHGGFTRHNFTCGEGTVWDSDIGACNHAWAVEKCGGGVIKDNNIQEITLPPSVPDHSSGYDNSYNTNQENDNDIENIKSTTLIPNINIVTPISNGFTECQSNGFMGNDKDCKIFYRCVENGNGNFIRYEFACGDGTVWDPKIAACNHVWAVERCGGSISVDRSNYTTASTVSEVPTQYTTSSSAITTLTSTVSDISNECRGNGFISDKQDCKKFYRCVEDEKGSYTRYEFACGDGTLWDPKIQACNHAWAVTSCGYNISPGSSHPPSTMRDEEIANNNTVTQSNQDISSSTEHNSWSSSTIKSSTKVDDVRQCNTEGFMGDTTDCRKFYRCVNDGKGNFIRYEFTCSDGTVWDSEINACNHVSSVKNPCTLTSTQTTKVNEPPYTASSPSEANDYSTTSIGPTNAQRCQQEGFLDDKTDCKKFYRCVDNGQGGFHKYEFACGEGTIWDQEMLACNHASSTSHCVSTVTEAEPENSDSHSTLTTSTSQSTEKTQISTSLQNECTSDGFYANPNDCKKFYRCVRDGKDGYIKYDFNCGEGTVWVQDIQACDHDNDPSLCSKDKNSTITNAEPSETKPVTTTSTSIATSTKDTATSTPNTKPTMRDETVSGSSSTTESSSASSTSASPGNQDHCEESGYFGNSQDCKMFYRCVDNGKGGFTKYDFTCGDGTIWDQDITACNHPQDVSNPSCDNEASSSNTTMTTKTTTTSSTTPTPTKTTEASEPTKGMSSTKTTTTESSNQEMNTAKPSDSNYTCTQAGFYADPNDCKKFYRCVDWGNDGKTFSIYHFDCGEGTIWDPELQTCNHEESVYPPRDCSGKQSQNENNNGSTTTTKQDETTESSTTEITTTTSQSTTEKSTSSESTTTIPSSSTTVQTSTQQPSTSEQSSSTAQSSTQSSTTERSTTQQSTTQPNTTQQSTTEQSTTQQSNTEKSTTQQSTTSDQTTQASTTQQSSTSEQTTTTTEQTTTTTNPQATTTTPEQTTTTTTEQTTTTTPEQSTTTEQTTTTTEQTTTTSNEETTTTAQTTTTESTTTTTDQTTKQTTTQESSTEQTSENQTSTTEQTTTQETSTGGSTTESGHETSTEQGSSDKECPQTENDQYLFVCPTGFRRHPKYCNLFYQCTEDDDSHEMKVAVFNCPNNTIYDESKTQCVEEEKADKKCDGQIAQRRRVKRLDANYKEPIAVGRQKYVCPALGHFPFEKNEECSPVLFKCEVSKSGKIRGLLYQCPQGYVYWSISRRCEPINIMIGCKRSLKNWSGRYEIPIERNNVARKTIK